MKVLFIENRYRTFFWDKIAEKLSEKGHSIYWIIQNHEFKPKTGHLNVIPYFKGKYYGKKEYTRDIKKVIQADRGLNYFGVKNDDHIFYYNDRINEIIEDIKPDVAFGECTLFHEYLAALNLKSRNVYYLHPSSCRYPVGRFSFYKWSTLEPFSGSFEKLDIENAEKIIRHIIEGTTKLDYMLKPIKLSRIEKIADKLKLLKGYILGERFNTPNPIVKYRLDKNKARNIQDWDKYADTLINDNSSQGLNILYPMQMQPEANIDIWGFPFNNQLEVIKQISSLLEGNDILYVKPNPKSKYELNDELLSFVRSNNKIRPLVHKSSMRDLFPKINLIITVTGTVAIEASLANIPVAMFGDTLLGNMQNCFKINSKTDLQKAMRLVRNSKFPTSKKEELVKYINLVHETSFPGILGDGLHNKQYIENSNNIQSLNLAFDRIVHAL